MTSPNDHQLDLLIEQALGEEPLRPVPAGFRRRVNERLHIAALAQKEREQVRFGLVTGGVLVAAVVMFLVFMPVISYLQGWTARSMPGGLGRLDYLATSVQAFLGTMNHPALWATAATIALTGLVLVVAAARHQALAVAHAKKRK